MKALWIIFCSCLFALQSCGGTQDQRSSRDMDQKRDRETRDMRDRYDDEDDYDLPRCPEERTQSKLDTPVTEKVNLSSAADQEEEPISAAKRSMKEELSASLTAQK